MIHSTSTNLAIRGRLYLESGICRQFPHIELPRINRTCGGPQGRVPILYALHRRSARDGAEIRLCGIASGLVIPMSDRDREADHLRVNSAPELLVVTTKNRHALGTVASSQVDDEFYASAAQPPQACCKCVLAQLHEGTQA